MDKRTPYWGNRLESEMRRKKITSSELAELMGVTPTAVSRWKSKRYPTLSAEKAAQLSEIFGCDYDQIFYLVVPSKTAETK